MTWPLQVEVSDHPWNGARSSPLLCPGSGGGVVPVACTPPFKLNSSLSARPEKFPETSFLGTHEEGPDPDPEPHRGTHTRSEAHAARTEKESHGTVYAAGGAPAQTQVFR